MRKKLVVLIMAAVAAVSLCACKKEDGKGSTLPTPEAGGTGTPAITSGASDGNGDADSLPITDYDACVATTTLPENYYGIEVKKITEQEVEEYIAGVLQDNVGTEEVDRAVEEGDVVDVDYAGYLDGVAFDGGTGNNPVLEIGSHSFIDGFEDGLIGMKKGESKSLPLKFPDEYKNNPDLAGKEVVFDVTVNSVSVYVLPEFTDAFVADLTGDTYQTTDEFRQYAEDMLFENRAYEVVMGYLLENTDFAPLNEEFIQANLKSIQGYYEMYAQLYGLDLDTFMLYYGVADAAAFWKEMEEELRMEEKERIVLYCVAMKEGITLTEEEFTEKATELAQSNGQTLEEFLAQQDRKYVEQSILMENGLNILLDHVTAVD